MYCTTLSVVLSCSVCRPDAILCLPYFVFPWPSWLPTCCSCILCRKNDLPHIFTKIMDSSFSIVDLQLFRDIAEFTRAQSVNSICALCVKTWHLLGDIFSAGFCTGSSSRLTLKRPCSKSPWIVFENEKALKSLPVKRPAEMDYKFCFFTEVFIIGCRTDWFYSTINWLIADRETWIGLEFLKEKGLRVLELCMNPMCSWTCWVAALVTNIKTEHNTFQISVTVFCSCMMILSYYLNCQRRRNRLSNWLEKILL